MLLDFFERSSVLGARRAGLVGSINELARAFRRHGQPIIWVRQEFRPDLEDAFLEMRRKNLHVTIAGTDGAEILPELERHPGDEVIVKKRYSAFFRTNLDSVLAGLEPSCIVVAGINTHACVRTTVIDAYQRDYDVVVAADGIASYDRVHHDVTVDYLNGKIARFLRTGEIVALLARKPAGRGDRPH